MFYRAPSQLLTIVQGPPGTGKSQTIANIVSCIQELKTGKAGGRPTVAIASTNKEAVRNALEGIFDLERVCDEHGHALRPLCVQLGNKDVRTQAIRELREQGNAGRLKDAGVPDRYKGGPLPLRFLDEYPVFGCRPTRSSKRTWGSAAHASTLSSGAAAAQSWRSRLTGSTTASTGSVPKTTGRRTVW